MRRGRDGVMAQYEASHPCKNCGRRFDYHAVDGNLFATPGKCPGDGDPKWPSTVRDEAKAQELFDSRLKKFWSERSTSFSPGWVFKAIR